MCHRCRHAAHLEGIYGRKADILLAVYAVAVTAAALLSWLYEWPVDALTIVVYAVAGPFVLMIAALFAGVILLCLYECFHGMTMSLLELVDKARSSRSKSAGEA